MQLQGKKEIVEAVVIAALSALATSLVNLGVDLVRDKAKPPQKEEDEETEDA